jgi:hypothetical protein
MKKRRLGLRIFLSVITTIVMFMLTINVIPPSKVVDYNPFLKQGSVLPMVAAHRGGATTNPQNTMKAFKSAVNECHVDIIESDFQFTSLNNSNSDVQWAIDNLSFGTALEPFDGMDIQINDVLCPGDEALFSLNVQIFDDVDSIPSGGIEISNISYSYDFVQADQIMCER